MFRSFLGRTSQTSVSSNLCQSTKGKLITQQPVWAIPQQRQQQLRLLGSSPCLHYERSRQKDTVEPSFTKKRNSTYRNRRFVDIEGAETRSNRHLYTLPRDVFGASERVAKLLKYEGIDEAHELLIHLPLELQSTVSWNQLLNQCGQDGRAALAESIFSQMRKRGFEPSDRTFAHIITAFVGNDSPTSCERAEAWIDKMQTYGIQPTAYHYNALLNVYSGAQQYNFVVAKLRQMMRDDGLLPYPDKVSLSIALKAVPFLINNPNKEIRRIWHYMVDCLKDDFGYNESQPYEPGSPKRRPVSSLQAKVKQLETTDITFRNDLLLAREQEKSLAAAKYHRQPLDIDDTLVVTLLQSLKRSNPKPGFGGGQRGDDKTEHLKLVIDIMEKLYGLRPSLPRVTELTDNTLSTFKCFGLAPGVTVLDAVVRYCGSAQEFELGEAYFDMAVQTFPSLEPDATAYAAYAWMQSNTRRKKFKNNKTGSGNV